MKYIIILGDGMADYPISELQGKTPLMAAQKPGMDYIAQKGRTGLFRTIEPDMATGSAVANLSVLGYNPRTDFNGRGVLEAASLGIQLEPEQLVFRVNLISVLDGKMKSHSSGHITNEEAHELIAFLQEKFKSWDFRLIPGLSYRHLLVFPGGSSAVECAPPHDHLDKPISSLMVQANEPGAQPIAQLLNDMILESNTFLENHPINIKRRQNGHLPANYLWPWSPGKKPQMKTFGEKYGIRGAVISAVDLIKGIGVYAGMSVLQVEGATGLYDTNYEGKADAALNALADHDFVYIHVEAADEAGHEKNLALKIKCIEDLDRRLVQRILNGIAGKEKETVIALLPDHATPVIHGAHTRDAIPVAIMDPRHTPDQVQTYDEESVKAGSLGLLSGSQFIETVLGKL
ncbi:MAG: cofactor-independent phosphoglycerate mutase [Acidobacteria bacterium]|jgi:2,3-bisphosphoglycerate-independent phosphoglycerate mutase|nr:cofactor-independent phosphoglycerate mutase [Acidobacteriota bacterium]